MTVTVVKEVLKGIRVEEKGFEAEIAGNTWFCSTDPTSSIKKMQHKEYGNQSGGMLPRPTITEICLWEPYLKPVK